MLFLLLGVVTGTAAFFGKRKRTARSPRTTAAAAIGQSLADLEKTQEKLSETAEMLALKNRLIDDLQMQLSEKEPGFGYDADRPSEAPKWEGLGRLKILTNADWEVFLGRFEAMFPGFLSRVKGAFPLLTVAETRLFLLTKICCFLENFLVSADDDAVSWSAAAEPNVSATVVGATNWWRAAPPGQSRFLGINDVSARLAKAHAQRMLRLEMDEEAWERFYGFKSHPIAKTPDWSPNAGVFTPQTYFTSIKTSAKAILPYF